MTHVELGPTAHTQAHATDSHVRQPHEHRADRDAAVRSRKSEAAVLGLVLMAMSATHARRAGERALVANVWREVDRIGHRWRRKTAQGGATAGAALGLLLLLNGLGRS